MQVFTPKATDYQEKVVIYMEQDTYLNTEAKRTINKTTCSGHCVLVPEAMSSSAFLSLGTMEQVKGYGTLK